jgi:SAM-dependent MidA family methyltransferase
MQGIKDHKFVDIFLEPGNVDLSVNVDFAGLARSAVSVSSADKALTNNNVRILGPVTQGNFLEEMGIDVRLAKLLREAKTESEARSLISSYERFVIAATLD